MTEDGKSRVALVTGASKGLGRALSGELASRGVKVVMVARGRAELELAAAEVRERGGPAPVPLVYDVGDKAAIHPLAGLAADLAGDVDILVHNASDLGPVPMPLLMDLDCEDLSRVFEVNVVGPFRLTKAVGGSMALRKRGTILFVSSDAAVNAYPGWGAYSSSKAAADHLAKVFAAELEIHGVRVLSVDPTDMDTEMHRRALPDSDPASLARPETIAKAFVKILEDPERARTGSRVSAGDWVSS
ncbi:MAG: SDR family oxidoreductase [Polyangiaceae bacterium]|nr:SDR family oxidoreductase [Polyangiaceae bacterium]